MRGIKIIHRPGRAKPYILAVNAGGKRSQIGFSTEAEALVAQKKAGKDRLEHGVAAPTFSGAAFREWNEARQLINDPAVRLSEVVMFWREHAKRGLERISVADAYVAFSKDKEMMHLSEKHMSDLSSRVGRFARDFGRMQVASLKSEMLLDWIKRIGGAPRTKKNNRLALANFMNYCERRKWTDKAPHVSELDLPKVKKGSTGILTVEQCAGLFQWLEHNRPHFTAWFAIQAFAGIRHAEAGRMRWEWFDFKNKRIVIPKEVCKTGDDWVMLDLPENLWAWLQAHRGEGKLKSPTNKSRDIIMRELRKEKIITEWPHNAMRHSACTYDISLREDASKTALRLRHRNTATLWESYLKHLVPISIAKKYFEISPFKNHPRRSKETTR